MTTFTWLHLTDLHQGSKDEKWRWDTVEEKFYDDLCKLHDKCGDWDLVLFTGDLTNRGEAEEFNKLDEFLDQLWEFFDGNWGITPALLAVPGNHDLARPDEKDPIALNLINLWDNKNVQDGFWSDLENKGTSGYYSLFEKTFHNYKSWWNAQKYRPPKIREGLLPGDFSYTLEKEGAKLGVVGLNSSYLHLVKDVKEKIAIDTRQFKSVCEPNGPTWARAHDVCILMTHHPPHWFYEQSRKEHYLKEIYSNNRFVCHICGHQHETKSTIDYIDEANRRWVMVGRSLFGIEYIDDDKNSQRSHGYSVQTLEIDEKVCKAYIWPRTVIEGEQGKEFIPDHTIPSLEDERKEFEIPLMLNRKSIATQPHALLVDKLNELKRLQGEIKNDRQNIEKLDMFFETLKEQVKEMSWGPVAIEDVLENLLMTVQNPDIWSINKLVSDQEMQGGLESVWVFSNKLLEVDEDLDDDQREKLINTIIKNLHDGVEFNYFVQKEEQFQKYMAILRAKQVSRNIMNQIKCIKISTDEALLNPFLFDFAVHIRSSSNVEPLQGNIVVRSLNRRQATTLLLPKFIVKEAHKILSNVKNKVKDLKPKQEVNIGGIKLSLVNI